MGRMLNSGDDSMAETVAKGWIEVVGYVNSEPHYRLTKKGMRHVEQHMVVPPVEKCDCDGPIAKCAVGPCPNYRVPNGRLCDEHLSGNKAGRAD